MKLDSSLARNSTASAISSGGRVDDLAGAHRRSPPPDPVPVSKPDGPQSRGHSNLSDPRRYIRRSGSDTSVGGTGSVLEQGRRRVTAVRAIRPTG